MDMHKEDFSTRVIDLPGHPDSEKEEADSSTAAVGAHGGQRPLAAGVTSNGRMVAAVSAQAREGLHLIDLGRGVLPLQSARLMEKPQPRGQQLPLSERQSFGEISGSSPKLVFVPMAEKQRTIRTVRQRTPSMGLVEATRAQVGVQFGICFLHACNLTLAVRPGERAEGLVLRSHIYTYLLGQVVSHNMHSSSTSSLLLLLAKRPECRQAFLKPNHLAPALLQPKHP